MGLLISAVAAVATWTFTANISIWIGIAIFITVLTIYHMGRASRLIVPLPHIAILISALQYILAAWLNYYFPPANPTFDSAAALPVYLAYAGPVIVAVVLGWAASLVRLRPPTSTASTLEPLVEFDILFGVGLAATATARFLYIPELAFVLVLIGNLRYVGVFGRMIAKAPGWKWRLAVVFAAEVLFATESAMFHPLLLWAFWAFAIWLYCFRPPVVTVVSALAGAALLLPALQESKWRLRGDLENDLMFSGTEMISGELAGYEKAIAWLGYLVDGVFHTVTGQLSDDFISDTLARYNQGWIITNVLAFVPEYEPYARGETLVDAARAALLPRLLDPNKLQAGGREKMLRFAGMDLGENTSMNLGYAGEMYANFGIVGGVVGCGAYALFFGVIFRAICRTAFERPILWSIVPYVFFSALKAEDGIGEVLNWTVKSCLVIGAVFLLLPNLRRALTAKASRGHTRGIVNPAAQEESAIVQHP